MVVGLDAATYDIIDPMVARGELPAVAKLLQGSRAVLESEKPIRSPALWTTIATGHSRHTHGIYDFVTGSNYWPKARRDEPRKLVTSDMRRSKAIWQYASDAGRRVLVVGWLNSWPAEKVNGVMVAPYVALGHRKQTSIKGKIYKDESGQTYPASLFSEIEPLIVSAESISNEQVRELADLPEPGSKLYAEIPKLERYIYTVKWSLAAALTNLAVIESQLAKGEQFDLVMTFFDGSDTLAHRFWLFRQPLEEIEARFRAHGIDPKLAPEMKRRFGRVVENYYRFFDRQLARLVRGVGPEATVMLMSDHGFATYPKARAIHGSTPFDGMHALDGILIAGGGDAAWGTRAARMDHYDVTPTLLYRLGLPVPKGLPGKVMTELFSSKFNRARRAMVSNSSTGRGAKTPKGEEPAHFEDAEIERLRSLGYVQ